MNRKTLGQAAASSTLADCIAILETVRADSVAENWSGSTVMQYQQEGHDQCIKALRDRLERENEALRKERDDALSAAGITHGVYPELYRLRAENEALRQPITITDRQIAEAMIAVDDPMQWGRLGVENKNMVRQFAHALLKFINAEKEQKP